MNGPASPLASFYTSLREENTPNTSAHRRAYVSGASATDETTYQSSPSGGRAAAPGSDNNAAHSLKYRSSGGIDGSREVDLGRRPSRDGASVKEFLFFCSSSGSGSPVFLPQGRAPPVATEASGKAGSASPAPHPPPQQELQQQPHPRRQVEITGAQASNCNSNLNESHSVVNRKNSVMANTPVPGSAKTPVATNSIGGNDDNAAGNEEEVDNDFVFVYRDSDSGGSSCSKKDKMTTRSSSCLCEESGGNGQSGRSSTHTGTPLRAPDVSVSRKVSVDLGSNVVVPANTHGNSSRAPETGPPSKSSKTSSNARRHGNMVCDLRSCRGSPLGSPVPALRVAAEGQQAATKNTAPPSSFPHFSPYTAKPHEAHSVHSHRHRHRHHHSSTENAKLVEDGQGSGEQPTHTQQQGELVMSSGLSESTAPFFRDKSAAPTAVHADDSKREEGTVLSPYSSKANEPGVTTNGSFASSASSALFSSLKLPVTCYPTAVCESVETERRQHKGMKCTPSKKHAVPPTVVTTSDGSNNSNRREVSPVTTNGSATTGTASSLSFASPTADDRVLQTTRDGCGPSSDVTVAASTGATDTCSSTSRPCTEGTRGTGLSTSESPTCTGPASPFTRPSDGGGGDHQQQQQQSKSMAPRKVDEVIEPCLSQDALAKGNSRAIRKPQSNPLSSATAPVEPAKPAASTTTVTLASVAAAAAAAAAVTSPAFSASVTDKRSYVNAAMAGRRTWGFDVDDVSSSSSSNNSADNGLGDVPFLSGGTGSDRDGLIEMLEPYCSDFDDCGNVSDTFEEKEERPFPLTYEPIHARPIPTATGQVPVPLPTAPSPSLGKGASPDRPRLAQHLRPQQPLRFSSERDGSAGSASSGSSYTGSRLIVGAQVARTTQGSSVVDDDYHGLAGPLVGSRPPARVPHYQKRPLLVPLSPKATANDTKSHQRSTSDDTNTERTSLTSTQKAMPARQKLFSGHNDVRSLGDEAHKPPQLTTLLHKADERGLGEDELTAPLTLHMSSSSNNTTNNDDPSPSQELASRRYRNRNTSISSNSLGRASEVDSYSRSGGDGQRRLASSAAGSRRDSTGPSTTLVPPTASPALNGGGGGMQASSVGAHMAESGQSRSPPPPPQQQQQQQPAQCEPAGAEDVVGVGHAHTTNPPATGVEAERQPAKVVVPDTRARLRAPPTLPPHRRKRLLLCKQAPLATANVEPPQPQAEE